MAQRVSSVTPPWLGARRSATRPLGGHEGLSTIPGEGRLVARLGRPPTPTTGGRSRGPSPGRVTRTP